MRDLRTKARGFALVAGLCAVAITAAVEVQPANAQDAAATRASVQPEAQGRAVYYVDFRARTAASYGHAFVWYGRADQKQIEVRSEEHTSELQSHVNLVCRLLLEKKNKNIQTRYR